MTMTIYLAEIVTMENSTWIISKTLASNICRINEEILYYNSIQE